MAGIETIQKWCDETRFKILDEYRNSGREASGEFGRSLETSIGTTPKGYSVKILGAKQAYWMENGRKPGGFPPIKSVREWIKFKGIVANGISENSLAYLIARRIANEGYKGKPLVSNVLTDSWIKELLGMVMMGTIAEIKSDVLKQFKNATWQ